MAKIKVGDVFSILTNSGDAFLHYIGKGWDGIERIRVLGFLRNDNDTVELLVSRRELFVIGFPLLAAYKKGIVKKTQYHSNDHMVLPRYSRSPNSIRGELLGWIIHDAEKRLYEHFVDLTDEQLKINPSGIINDTLLIERLESGFSLEKWNSDYILAELEKSAAKKKLEQSNHGQN
jgi:hypothetical protein